MTEVGCCEMVVERDHGRVWSCDYRTREGRLIHNRIYADSRKQAVERFRVQLKDVLKIQI